jgi:outer membrane protein assembly factor BamB
MYRAMTILLVLAPAIALGGDWTMGGRTPDRNPVSPEKAPPTEWQVGDETTPPKNIRWSAKVGSDAIGGPVVANGLVWVGTNNKKPLDPKVKGDCGVYACFRESDGKFLYQYASPRLELDKIIADWPTSGTGGSPVAEADRVWFIINRREVVCLDTKPLSEGKGPAEVVWKYDLIKKLGVYPNSPMIPSTNNVGSPAVYKDWLYVPTGNGVDVDYPGATKVRAPEAPSLVCFEKATGKVVWKDNSPSKEGYGGNHASPLVLEVGGKARVIHPQTDGWVRAFDAATGKLVWKFDINHKGAQWDWLEKDSTKSKAVVVANPVFADGRLYFAAGREPEAAIGPGRLFCIDPTKSGDISPEIDDEKGGGKPNPASAVIWQFTKNGDKEGELMHQTVSSIAVHEGLLIAPDRIGYVHCLDAKTGKHYWSHDTKCESHFADPLLIDGKVYIGSDDGNVTILELSKKLRVLKVNELFNRQIRASPIFANGTLYLQTRSVLYAVAVKK